MFFNYCTTFQLLHREQYCGHVVTRISHNHTEKWLLWIISEKIILYVFDSTIRLTVMTYHYYYFLSKQPRNLAENNNNLSSINHVVDQVFFHRRIARFARPSPQTCSLHHALQLRDAVYVHYATATKRVTSDNRRARRVLAGYCASFFPARLFVFFLAIRAHVAVDLPREIET